MKVELDPRINPRTFAEQMALLGYRVVARDGAVYVAMTTPPPAAEKPRKH